jgi:hypothetical protein
MRTIAVCALVLSLGACGSSQRAAEQDALRASTTDCLVRETQAVAPQPIDLETAMLAVLARCDYPGVLERSIASDYPGYRGYVHERIQARYDEIKDSVRRGIAVMRTQRVSSPK